MKTHPLTFPRILAIGFILLCTAAAWFLLGSALLIRTHERDAQLGEAVSQVWGSPLSQSHPTAWYVSPNGEHGRKLMPPEASAVSVTLDYAPKSKGLLWYRTYAVHFQGTYRISNPTPIAQTIYVSFQLPSGSNELESVSFQLGEGPDAVTASAPQDGALTQAVTVPPGGFVPLKVAYRTRGLDTWTYRFGDASRLHDFALGMSTNFGEIDFPAGTSSPAQRARNDQGGWDLEWKYTDVIHPHAIGIAMPNVLNAGPVAARISFFAPVSLVFFFAVLLILGAVRGMSLHPMNYFFLAAGCFAFQLLFAYLVDLAPVHLSFVISAAVSLVLVCGYLQLLGGRALTRIALPAQFAYMVLFSYSFFFDGMSGLTITIGAIVTLAILMLASAKVDWAQVFARSRSTQPAAPV